MNGMAEVPTHEVPPSIGFLATMRIVWDVMSPRRRVQLFVTIAFMLLGAFAELITIGAMLLFLAIAANTGHLEKLPLLHSVLTRFSETFGGNMVAAAAVLLICTAVFAAVSWLLLKWVRQKFVYGVQLDLTLKVFGRVIRKRYDHLVRQNSSTVLAGFEKIYRISNGVIAHSAATARQDPAIMGRPTGWTLGPRSEARGGNRRYFYSTHTTDHHSKANVKYYS